MKSHNQVWPRLAAAACRVPADGRDVTAPLGFATRVAALAMTAEPPFASLFERFSWRALGVAGLLALVSVAADYSVFAANTADDELPTDESAVTAILDLAS